MCLRMMSKGLFGSFRLLAIVSLFARSMHDGIAIGFSIVAMRVLRAEG